MAWPKDPRLKLALYNRYRAQDEEKMRENEAYAKKTSSRAITFVLLNARAKKEFVARDARMQELAEEVARRKEAAQKSDT